jgi:hypothetical protein
MLCNNGVQVGLDDVINKVNEISNTQVCTELELYIDWQGTHDLAC